MNINDLYILFLISRVKTNKKGLAPIRCRITLYNKRKIFSTGLFVEADKWNNKTQLAKPSNEDNNFINTQLSLIKNKINQAFLFLQVQGNEFNAEDVYNQYAGIKLNIDKSVLDVFNEHIKNQEKLIGIETTKVSVAKFYQTKKHLQSFIWYKFKKNDYMLKQLKGNFITEFEFYLKAEKKFKHHTVYKTIQRFRQIVKLAVAKDYINKDPFMLHKNPKPKKEIVFLNPMELETLANHIFSQKRLESVKDMFIFCCYTGLAYNEMAKLEPKHIIIGFDNNKWIQMIRDKTQKQISVPLLQKTTNIIEKYYDVNNQYLLPRISNQRFNSYLKEIAEIVGIEKNLTHHIARKTFATTVLLYNDVPMEIVSELLGHSKMSITQEYYGKIVQKKVSEHIGILAKKMER